ncbi:MAG TPA: HAMP domain-containing histidine kinase [Candidatus Gemmiger faecigallinarum]|nr:HAMP domain-containing histidine kinase [Candidatus Gemmiger faecigallinarum]
MRAKSISREFFASVAAVVLLGLGVMCLSQSALSISYFAQERHAALTGILDGAAAVSEQLAGSASGIIITDPIPDESMRERAESRLELFNTATQTLLFVTDDSGTVLLHTGSDDVLTGEAVPADLLARINAEGELFTTGDMNGVFSKQYYVLGRPLQAQDSAGYIFAATDMGALGDYVGDMANMFLLSAAIALIVASVLSAIFARRFTEPIEAISEAARKLGSGDFTARAPVNGCTELADFAVTFNNMAARLQTIDNSRGQFMGNIAHELRTPMTTIQGFIDGMLDGTIPPQEQKKYLEIVSQETGRLSRLVKNMLDITKLEAGEYQLHARCYDIWETVTDVVLSDEQRIEDAKIDIQGLGGGRAMVYADPDFVHQVVYNIVDNAIKFTPPDGVIRFATRRVGDKIEMSIENTGAGIAPDALPFVFDRFYKEDRSRGLNTRGSGLGLHICKVLVNLSGGEIRVESQEGEWCRFTFSLPAGDAKKGEDPKKSAPVPARR